MHGLAWPHLSVTNVIDIVLVAFVIYQFLMLVRGTRAAPMLVGFIALKLGGEFLVAFGAALLASRRRATVRPP